jgi:phosphoesterase RecJ-like protein
MSPKKATSREISRILKNEDRFIVVTHVNPDGDAVGSLLGATLALKELGKLVAPVIRNGVPDLYTFMPGMDLVVADVRDAGFDPAWIVSVDAAEKKRISADISFLDDRARLINIDHHNTNPLFGDLNLVEEDATSTAEIVHTVLKDAGYTLSKDAGMCLYAGLITDTGGFRFSGVNSRTLAIGAEMLASGFDSYEVARPLFEEHPLRRLYLERLMLERMEIHLGGRLIVSELFESDFVELGAEKSDTENLVDRLREVKGVESAALLTEISAEHIRVSFRSKGRVDVAKIANQLGGGGHRAAAGAKSSDRSPVLKRKIISAFEDALRHAPRVNPTESGAGV